jgi:hypothetical protein
MMDLRRRPFPARVRSIDFTTTKPERRRRVNGASDQAWTIRRDRG